MGDKPVQLQHLPDQHSLPAVISEVRSSLIARARRDASSLTSGNPQPTGPATISREQSARSIDITDADAQFELARKYYLGEGVLQDYGQAASWFRKAAEHGHVKAQYNLGVICHNGEGVARNLSEAAAWFRRAGDQGLYHAQNLLYWLYDSGVEMSASDAEAAKLFHKEANQDESGIAERQMRAAEQGDAYAQNAVGERYNLGLDVPHDIEAAQVWFRKAAEQGLALAQENLGWTYSSSGDLDRAAIWIRKAADQGYSHAQHSLGELYQHGWGVAQDYALAADWYTKAAAQGDGKASRDLARLFYHGHGVTQSYVEAYFWLNVAAARMRFPEDRDEVAAERDNVTLQLQPAQILAQRDRARKWVADNPVRLF